MPRFVRYLLPLAIFVVLAAFLYRGLSLDPKKVPSPLVGKPAPAFSLPTLNDPASSMSQTDFAGKVSLFNVWATWCVSCRAEHQVLMALARSGKVDIYGLNYKDTRSEARRWLQNLGDPYVANAFDQDGRVGINWGVYGTPETFVIDHEGIIRYKHIGPISEKDMNEVILPLVEQLRSERG
jgi:cytochrome c biogenesis protein CcmG/thiol:disulfide interchange protein DsbE